MFRRYLQISLLGVLVVGSAPVVQAADDPALVKQVQGMLVKHGYLRASDGTWGDCSQRAAAAFLSDAGYAGLVPELPQLADEMKKAKPDLRRTGDPVC